MIKIEDPGLDLLIVVCKHPAYAGNRILKQLYLSLNLEWACRRSGETAPDPDQLKLDHVTDLELKEAAGGFYGLCRAKEVQEYEKTFGFCTAIFLILNAEIEIRSAKGQPVH